MCALNRFLYQSRYSEIFILPVIYIATALRASLFYFCLFYRSIYAYFLTSSKSRFGESSLWMIYWKGGRKKIHSVGNDFKVGTLFIFLFLFLHYVWNFFYLLVYEVIYFSPYHTWLPNRFIIIIFLKAVVKKWHIRFFFSLIKGNSCWIEDFSFFYLDKNGSELRCTECFVIFILKWCIH